MNRQYKISDLPRGRRGQQIVERTGDTANPVLWLPPEVPAETKFDLVQVLNRAYQTGREDRALECPSEPALTEPERRLILSLMDLYYTSLGISHRDCQALRAKIGKKG